uniref:Uncharacterized protein n=1 Tax=Cacopsylla melanoneura TaxID=428564 RepID=A0A8D8QQ80_9HEMI
MKDKYRIRNEEIRRTVQEVSMEEKIMKRRLRWHGHLQRMENERLPKKMYNLRIEGNRPKGRPRYRYHDVIKIDIGKKGGCWNDIETRELFKDRFWWRGFIHRPV